MNEAYIFDIDGCIIDDNFGIGRVPESKVSYIREKMKGLTLWEEFRDFYQKNNKIRNTIFITGRKYSHFGDITHKQLPKTASVIFYPENLKHVPEEYFEWKKAIINAKISQFIIDGYKTIHIFDDHNEYFNHFEGYNNIKLHKITSRKDWKEL